MPAGLLVRLLPADDSIILLTMPPPNYRMSHLNHLSSLPPSLHFLSNREFTVTSPAPLKPPSLPTLPPEQVRICRSRNASRRSGVGNHWLTGHQRHVRDYKVRE